jgi:DNA-directed RNA polymerase specialized sigma24 family protein
MGERFFSIEQAAEILGCSRTTVYRLLAEGWLKRPAGWTKMESSARVGEKSVFQLMIFDCLSHFPIKTLKEFKNGRKNFSRLLSQTADANRFSKFEGTGTTPENVSSTSLPKNDEQKRCLHHDFAAEHQFSFGWLARQLVKDDPALRDDLVQEMSLAVLQYEKPANCEYLLQLAENRAIDYLRYEERRGMMPLNEAQHESDTFESKMANLRHLIEALTHRGVPQEWIDEILGERLDEGPSEFEMGLADAG